METETETIQRLMEIGYVAAGIGLHAEAESIFMGIQAARPDSEYPQIGWSVVRMNAGLYEDAVRILRNVIDQKPESDVTRAYLGLALHLGGRNGESEANLKEVIKNDRDEAAVKMARSLLEGEIAQESDAS